MLKFLLLLYFTKDWTLISPIFTYWLLVFVSGIPQLEESGEKKWGHLKAYHAAAYTHTSVGISDAVRGVKTPVIEVHISNTKSREDFRKKSFISPHAQGIIQGFGLYSYDLAILSLLKD